VCLALSAAQALAFTSVVNGGFETDCVGVPCSWSAPQAGSAIDRQTSSPHSGSASMRLLQTSGTGKSAQQCLTATAGRYSFSFWYRTAAANVIGTQGNVFFYASNDCSGAALDIIGVSGTATTDDTWRQRSTSGDAPVGTQSALIALSFSCTANNCANGLNSVNYDDATLDGGGPPTAVRVLGFSARRAGSSVTVRWRAASQTGAVAYALWRDGRQLETVAAINARGVYRVVDRLWADRRAHVYRLETIALDGSRTAAATARVPGR
jgi:hypothetical protein